MFSLRSIRPPVLPFTLLILAACTQVSPALDTSTPLGSQGVSYNAQDLGTLGDSETHAQGVSADGATIVGQGETYYPRNFVHANAFVWTEAGGIQKLGTLSEQYETRAYGISADGSTVAGRSQLPGHEIHATRWIVANPTPESATYTTDFERAPTSRPLYSLRVSQGVTGPDHPRTYLSQRQTAYRRRVPEGSVRQGSRSLRQQTPGGRWIKIGQNTERWRWTAAVYFQRRCSLWRRFCHSQVFDTLERHRCRGDR